jgi:DNA-binding PadR family transcriptional regulator
MAYMDYLDRTMFHGNAETLVLAILADRDCHGYELRKELAARSDEYFQFAFGRLYPLLQSLERRGLVRVRLTKSRFKRDCREYALTGKGATALRDRKLKWRQFSAAMNQVLSRT